MTSNDTTRTFTSAHEAGNWIAQQPAMTEYVIRATGNGYWQVAHDPKPVALDELVTGWEAELQLSRYLTVLSPRKVQVIASGVAAFNRGYPCSGLRDTRGYWFEFDEERNLIDCDVPESDDGSGATAMAQDCERYFFDNELPEWEN